MDEEVVYKKFYPIAISYHDKVHEELKSLQEQGIILLSRSAYNTPLICVLKKDGGIKLQWSLSFGFNKFISNDPFEALSHLQSSDLKFISNGNYSGRPGSNFKLPADC